MFQIFGTTIQSQTVAAAAASLLLGIVIGFIVGRLAARRQRFGRKFKKSAPGMVEIYIGNLSYDTTEAYLRKEFEKYGEVATVRIITGHSSHKSKGYGFIEMPNRPEAEKAIAAMHGADVQGRRLHVNEARNSKN